MLLSGVSVFASSETSTFSIKVETGPVWQSFNEVQIPASGGTRFDLKSLGSGPGLSFRLDAAWRVSENGELRALYAPLSLGLSGRLPSAVSFQGETFNSFSDVQALYRFNSYRLTYRYRLINTETMDFWIGVTGKVRDAEIKLSQGGISASRTNIGVVPLLHLLYSYRFSSKFRGIFEADALAAPQGRAEDVSLAVAYSFTPSWEGFVGYRTVEGGSNGGGSVYNFTWLHYGIVGAGIVF